LRLQIQKYEEDMSKTKSAGSDSEKRLQDEVVRLKNEIETLKKLYEEKLQTERKNAENNLNNANKQLKEEHEAYIKKINYEAEEARGKLETKVDE